MFLYLATIVVVVVVVGTEKEPRRAQLGFDSSRASALKRAAIKRGGEREEGGRIRESKGEKKLPREKKDFKPFSKTAAGT